MSIKKIKTTNSNTIARLVSLKGSVKNCLILECASYELSFFFFLPSRQTIELRLNDDDDYYSIINYTTTKPDRKNWLFT